MSLKDITTIQVPIPLNARIKVLAKSESERMGLSTPLSVRQYVEILVQRAEADQKTKEA